MRDLKYPPYVQWEVTSECNHNCIHCYNYWRKDTEKSHEMTKELASEDYLKIAKAIARQKPISVTVTGGEPLLVFDKIKSSIDYLLSKHIQVSINTNIALLNSEIANYLKAKKVGLFVSFPCLAEEIFNMIVGRKAFKKVIEKLDFAQENGIYFTMNIVVSKVNIRYIEETVSFLKKRYDIKSISITRVGKPINSDNSFDQYMLKHEDIKYVQEVSLSVAKKYNIIINASCPYTACSLYSQEAFDMFAYTKNCSAGKTSFAIDVDGNIKACPRDSNLYGNILTEKFEQIWKNMIDWRNDTYVPNLCKSCKVFGKCNGGCRVDSFPFTGKLDEPDLISDVSNLPIVFEKSCTSNNTSFKSEEIVRVNENIEYVKEHIGYRAKTGIKYIFLTDEMYRFIYNKSSFSLKELEYAFDVDNSVANTVVSILIANNIVCIKDEGGMKPC